MNTKYQIVIRNKRFLQTDQKNTNHLTIIDIQSKMCLSRIRPKRFIHMADENYYDLLERINIQ